MSHAATKPATAAPIVNALETINIAVTRARFGLYSLTSAIAFGIVAPRPKPARKRTTRSCSSECTCAVSSVSTPK